MSIAIWLRGGYNRHCQKIPGAPKNIYVYCVKFQEAFGELEYEDLINETGKTC